MKTEHRVSVQHNLLIIGLTECVAFAGLWLWNEYVATYATVTLPAVMLIILILSLIADWIEPSRIPKWYYIIMIISILIPLAIGGIFIYLNGGMMDWGRLSIISSPVNHQVLVAAAFIITQ